MRKLTKGSREIYAAFKSHSETRGRKDETDSRGTMAGLEWIKTSLNVMLVLQFTGEDMSEASVSISM